MYDLLGPLRQVLDSGRPAVWCRLVETRGSTPQKAGAAMLVYADGAQAGTLGGGCVEAEVKRRALAALAGIDGGAPRIDRFNLDSDYGWDDGLICGGRMQVLIQPIHTSGCEAYFRKLVAQLETGAESGCTEVVRFESPGTGASPAGYLLNGEGQLVANWPQAAGETEEIAADLKPLSIRPAPYALRGVAYLPVLPRCRLIIVGAGHVGQAVANLAADLDFDVWVADDRAEFASPERFPRAARRVVGDISQTLPDLEITGDTYCLIVTRGHHHDEEALALLIDRGARYVGLIGSRRKIKLIFDDLRAQGVSAASLEEVYAPLGIDIGSQTVPEIAVSICAELVSHRNRQGQVPGRPERVSVGT